VDKKPLLNQDQKKAYQFIMDQVLKQQGGIIFLDASGGTGKTFLINLILAEIRARGEISLPLPLQKLW
jgi:tRNA A37 threonylcarbamoyladenosine biosynthesis protein TsaE